MGKPLVDFIKTGVADLSSKCHKKRSLGVHQIGRQSGRFVRGYFPQGFIVPIDGDRAKLD